MALVTICDNCHNDWLVDQLVYVDAIEKNCCPVCVNQLVDLCFSRLTHAVICQIEERLQKVYYFN